MALTGGDGKTPIYEYNAAQAGFVATDPNGRRILSTEKVYDGSAWGNIRVTYEDGGVEIVPTLKYAATTGRGIADAKAKFDFQQPATIAPIDTTQAQQAQAIQAQLGNVLQRGQVVREQAYDAADRAAYVPTRGQSSQLGAALLTGQRGQNLVAAERAAQLGYLESQGLAAAAASDLRAQGQTLGQVLFDQAASNQAAQTALASGRRQSALAETDRRVQRVAGAAQGLGEAGMGYLQYQKAQQDEQRRMGGGY